MCLNPRKITHKGHLISVDCGQCVDCRKKRATAWAYRVVLEAQQYSDNCMLTLTYNEDNLPGGASLVLRDLQNFLKRLRKRLSPAKIRYFACGEYGSKGNRPHYHVIIFGWKPADMYYFFTDKKGNDLYRSPLIEKVWDFGFSTVGEVNLDTAKYCAIYLQKSPSAEQKKPFVVMSRRPGLGFAGFNEKWLKSDKIYLQGKYISIPRYFLDKVDASGGDTSSIRDKRFATALHFAESDQEQFLETERRKKNFERFFNKTLDNKGKI